MLTLLLAPLVIVAVAALFGARRPMAIILAAIAGIAITWFGFSFWAPRRTFGAAVVQGDDSFAFHLVAPSSATIIAIVVAVVLIVVLVRKFFPPGRTDR